MTPSDGAPRARVYASEAHETSGRRIAERLGVPFGPGETDVVIVVSDEGIAALGPGGFEARRVGPEASTVAELARRAVRVDLARVRPGSEPVVRAVRGRSKGEGVSTVVDATCGWGVDAGALWRAGLQVTAIERDPLLAVLLEDGVRRLSDADPAAAERFVLRVGDARQLLLSLTSSPDVVYLDPMYPRSRGGGAKRRGAAWLRGWLGEAEASDVAGQRELLRLARSVATRRVVVKRPARGAELAPGASGSITGRTTRFDLYAPLRPPSGPANDDEGE